MPKLSELTDAHIPQETIDSLPVENPFVSVPADPDGVRRVRIDTVAPKQEAAEPGIFSQNADKFINALFRDDDKRYQLWPERMVREGLSAAGDVMSGKVPQWAIDPETGDVHTSPNMVEKAQEMSALAGTGGLAGMTTDATLGATPFLRPALKYKDKLYKGKDGQQHMDVIPASIYPEFQRQAMSGEDISNFQFGFVNEKGHFLDREKALKHAIDTGLVDPQAAQYGALTAPVLERMQNNGSMSVYPDKGFSGGGLNIILTTQLLADSSKPGIAIEAMKKAQPFFSAVEHNVNAIPQAKMTGDQWLGTLSNKPGVKGEELSWTGLQDFLMENKGKPVTKEQIVEHLNNNKIELKEITKGAGEAKIVTPRDRRIAEEYVSEAHPRLDPASQRYRELVEEQFAHLTAPETNTKYHGYQLPGGENYREMLLTLPKGDDAINARMTQIEKLLQSRPAGGEATRDALRAEYKDLSTKAKDSQLYKSSHWDEPNILAHVRMNDRTIDGKKSLHLEEIQSDWHQQGRDKGYKGSVKPEELKLIDKEVDDAKRNLVEYFNKQKMSPEEISGALNNIYTRGQSSFVGPSGEKLAKAYSDATTKYHSAHDLDNKTVPDAPFKKSWHELALKRMLREAAEKGYDRLSWTPGEAQAARYDLSKQVDNISYLFNKDKTKVTINAGKNNGDHVFSQNNVPVDKVSDYVGKELAQKIKDDGGKLDHDTGYKVLSGVDLKVGGEGMKGFYDKMIPQAIEKLGKEHGVKVKSGEVATDKPGFDIVSTDGSNYATYATKERAESQLKIIAKEEGVDIGKLKVRENPTSKSPIHYIDIPQSLKDQAMHKGFPLFSAGGHMLIPVSHDPFKDETK